MQLSQSRLLQHLLPPVTEVCGKFSDLSSEISTLGQSSVVTITNIDRYLDVSVVVSHDLVVKIHTQSNDVFPHTVIKNTPVVAVQPRTAP